MVYRYVDSNTTAVPVPFQAEYYLGSEQPPTTVVRVDTSNWLVQVSGD